MVLCRKMHYFTRITYVLTQLRKAAFNDNHDISRTKISPTEYTHLDNVKRLAVLFYLMLTLFYVCLRRCISLIEFPHHFVSKKLKQIRFKTSYLHQLLVYVIKSGIQVFTLLPC